MNRHGGNLRDLACRARRSPAEIIDFSASINPLGPPESLRGVISRHIDELVHYPDPEAAELAAALAAKHNLAPGQVVVGNGSTELLFALAEALDYSRAVIPVPAYVDYAASVRRAGRTVEEVPLSEHDGFQLDPAALGQRLHGGELVIVGQPNNPTGRLINEDGLRACIAAHPTTRFVIDEAFAGFVPDYRCWCDVLPSNVIVLSSLTKLFAIAGLRLGFAAAAPDVAAAIRRRILPWSVNTLAQAVGIACLTEEEYVRRTVEIVAHARRKLADSLGRLPGLDVLPSDANFLLVRLSRTNVAALTEPLPPHPPPLSREGRGESVNAYVLAERLLERGIAIRTFGPGQYLDGRFFRVAVRTAEENAALVEALAELLGTGPETTRGLSRSSADACGSSENGLPFRNSAQDAGPHVPGNCVQCRQERADGSDVPDFARRRLSRGAVQVAEHVAEFLGDTHRRRDGPGTGLPGPGVSLGARRANEYHPAQARLRHRQSGHRPRPAGGEHPRVGQYVAYKPQAWVVACQCYDSLAAEFDCLVLEGAGSPGEVDLKSHDIVNMRMAQHAAAPVLIVGDIDRGGLFASFVGTMEVLAPWERKLVAGWVINRFRGDAALLAPAFDYTLGHTGRPVLGVVPYLHGLDIPQEDSVEFKAAAPGPRAVDPETIDIAVIDLPHLSNFTDFDPLRIEPDVCLRVVRTTAQLGRPDAVILGGSKNSLDDLAWLRSCGLDEALARLASQGRCEIVGICGGFQMLGRQITDPLGIESAGQRSHALGLLDVTTVMAAQKTLTRTTARHEASGLEVSGYEIHHGRTDVGACVPVLARTDGEIVGVAAADGRVWGTYLHGIFDADRWRRWFIDQLRVRRGLTPLGDVAAHYDIEPVLERLAHVVRQALPIEKIYRWMGLR